MHHTPAVFLIYCFIYKPFKFNKYSHKGKASKHLNFSKLYTVIGLNVSGYTCDSFS